MAQFVVAYIAGVLFAAGVMIADVTNPQKVVSFLDVAGDWDPTLGVVVGCAIAMAAIGYLIARRTHKPLLADKFPEPARGHVDASLVAGAALFGVGWGLGGYCPAPALTGLVFLNTNTFVFVGTMLVGMAVFSLLRRT